MPETRDIDARVCVDDLLGPLGYANKESVSPAIMEQILVELEQCADAIHGKTIFTIAKITRDDADRFEVNGVAINDRTLAGSLDDAESLGVAICTLGAGIDTLIEERFRRGDFLRGMIADVIASRAAEGVAERCAALMCSEAQTLRLSPADRLSPGYGKWAVDGQRAVFALLDPAPIGVSLNDYCMMTPKKSVSFVIPLTRGDAKMKSERPCASCTYKNCGYRRTGDAAT